MALTVITVLSVDDRTTFRKGLRDLLKMEGGLDAYIRRAAELGLAGFLVKQASAGILAKVIRQIHTGDVFFNPSIAERLSGQRRKSPSRATRGRKDAVHHPLMPGEVPVELGLANRGANSEE